VKVEGAGKEKEKRKREEIFLDQVHLGSRLVFITEHPSKISWGCLLFFFFFSLSFFFFLGEFRAGQSKPRRRAASKQH
jgi:hypothetical protein